MHVSRRDTLSIGVKYIPFFFDAVILGKVSLNHRFDNRSTARSLNSGAVPFHAIRKPNPCSFEERAPCNCPGWKGSGRWSKYIANSLILCTGNSIRGSIVLLALASNQCTGGRENASAAVTTCNAVR